jgi:hypothetical protein
MSREERIEMEAKIRKERIERGAKILAAATRKWPKDEPLRDIGLGSSKIPVTMNRDRLIRLIPRIFRLMNVEVSIDPYLLDAFEAEQLDGILNFFNRYQEGELITRPRIKGLLPGTLVFDAKSPINLTRKPPKSYLQSENVFLYSWRGSLLEVVLEINLGYSYDDENAILFLFIDRESSKYGGKFSMYMFDMTNAFTITRTLDDRGGDFLKKEIMIFGDMVTDGKFPKTNIPWSSDIPYRGVMDNYMSYRRITRSQLNSMIVTKNGIDIIHVWLDPVRKGRIRILGG